MAILTIDQAIQKLDDTILDLEKEMPLISEELATNAMALIIDRIQKEGLPGKSYSTNKLPAWWFADDKKILNAGGRALLQKQEKNKLRSVLKQQYGENIKLKKGGSVDDLDEGISYHEWRAANGLQVAFIDLTFTGRMFQNVQVLGTIRRGDNFITILGATDAENKKKLEWNRIRFGDFFILHEEDQKIIQQLGELRVNTIIKKHIP